MAAEWYYFVGGVVRGPFDARTIRSMAERGELKATDLICHGEHGEWVEARRLKGLEFGVSAPRSDEAAPLAFSESEMPTHHASTPEVRKAGNGVSLASATLVAIFAILVAFGLSMMSLVWVTIEYGFYLPLLLNQIGPVVGFGGILFFLVVLRRKQSR